MHHDHEGKSHLSIEAVRLSGLCLLIALGFFCGALSDGFGGPDDWILRGALIGWIAGLSLALMYFEARSMPIMHIALVCFLEALALAGMSFLVISWILHFDGWSAERIWPATANACGWILLGTMSLSFMAKSYRNYP